MLRIDRCKVLHFLPRNEIACALPQLGRGGRGFMLRINRCKVPRTLSPVQRSLYGIEVTLDLDMVQ